MRQVALRDTRISAVGFGCGDRAGLMVGDDTRAQAAVVGRALEAGITYFDTAAKYGAGRSEHGLAVALRANGCDPGGDVVVGTKIELPPDRAADLPAAVADGVAASLRRLGVDHVYLGQLHDRVVVGGGSRAWAPPGGRLLEVGEVLAPGGVGDALVRLREAGTISAIGVTAFGGDPAAVAEIIDSGLVDTVNCAVHLLNPTALAPAPDGWPALDHGGVAAHAHATGVTVMAIRALAGGVLLGRAPATDVDRRDVAWNERVARLVDRVGDPRAAIAWVHGWPQVDVVVAGVTAAAHVDDAVAAERAALRWSAAAVERWRQGLRAALDGDSE